MNHGRDISGNNNSGSKHRHASSNAPPFADPAAAAATDDRAATAAAVERERRIVASLEAQLALLRRAADRKRRRCSTAATTASRGRGGNADAHGSASLTPPGDGGGDRLARPTGTGGDVVDDHRPRGDVGRTPAREDSHGHVRGDDSVNVPPRRHRRTASGKAATSHAGADGAVGGMTDGPGSDGEQQADGEELPVNSVDFRRDGDASRCARNLLDVLDLLGSQSTRAAEEAAAGALNSAAGIGGVGSSSYRYVDNPRAVRIAPLASGVYFTGVRVVPVPDVDSEGNVQNEGPRLDHDGEINATEVRRLRRTRYELCGAVLPQVGDLSFRIDVTAALPRKGTRKAGESDRASEEARVEALAVKFMKRNDRAVAYEEKIRSDGIPSGMGDGDAAAAEDDTDPTSPVQETASASSSLEAAGTFAKSPAAPASVMDGDTGSGDGSSDGSSKPEQHHRQNRQTYFPTDELSELTAMMTTTSTSTSPVSGGGGGGGGRTNVPRLVRAIVAFAEFDSKRRRALCGFRRRYGDDRLRLVSAQEFHVRILAPPPRPPRPPRGDSGSGDVVRCVLCFTWRWQFSLCCRGKERLTLEDVVRTSSNHEKPSGSNGGDRVSSVPGLEEITDDNLQRLVSSVGGDGGCESAIDIILEATTFQC